MSDELTDKAIERDNALTDAAIDGFAALRAERDAALAEAKQEFDMGSSYHRKWQKARKRGDTYKARADALYCKLRRDTAAEAKWEKVTDEFMDWLLDMIDPAGPPSKLSPADRLRAYGERLKTAEAENKRLRELLERIGQWDMLGATADGPYWHSEITAALTPKEQ